MHGDEWRALNRANWDERVDIHLRAPMYDLSDLREGRARLEAIEEAELGDVTGERIHVKCPPSNFLQINFQVFILFK